jgi:hypothetical protein
VCSRNFGQHSIGASLTLYRVGYFAFKASILTSAWLFPFGRRNSWSWILVPTIERQSSTSFKSRDIFSSTNGCEYGLDICNRPSQRSPHCGFGTCLFSAVKSIKIYRCFCSKCPPPHIETEDSVVLHRPPGWQVPARN